MLLSKASRAGAGRAGRRRFGLRRAAYGLVVVALSAIAVALGAAVAPRLAGIQGLAITSGSMGDAAPTGSLVYTRDRPASAVRPGDVIVMERPGRPIVVHRVVSVGTSEGTLVAETKGDVNVAADPDPYPLPDRVPVMVRSVPLIGYLVTLLQRPLGWLLLVVLPAAAVAASVLRDLWRKAPAPVVIEQQPVPEEAGAAAAAEAEAVAVAEAVPPPVPATAGTTDTTVPEERLAELARWVAPRPDNNVVPFRERAAEPEQEVAAVLPTPAAVAPEPVAAPEPAVAPPAPAPEPHLLYVPAGKSYRLVERAGEPLRAGATVEVDGRVLAVLRVGASPLPGDRRRCAFVLEASASRAARPGALQVVELPRAVEPARREAGSG